MAYVANTMLGNENILCTLRAGNILRDGQVCTAGILPASLDFMCTLGHTAADVAMEAALALAHSEHTRNVFYNCRMAGTRGDASIVSRNGPERGYTYQVIKTIM